MIYLASPYNHPNAKVRDNRYTEALEAMSRLLLLGINVYSPIACWHVAANLNLLPNGYEFFKNHDEEMILLCKRFIILTLPGWKQSEGIAKEVRWATLNHKFVEYISLDDLRKGKFIPHLRSIGD